MRLLLAVLAVLGLLLTPAAASGATVRCALGSHGDMAMAAPSGAAAVMAEDGAPDEASAVPMPCCDDEAKPPSHDGKACAQDCALMCATPAALPEVASPAAPAVRHARLSAVSPRAIVGQAPPGLKRPPRTFI